MCLPFRTTGRRSRWKGSRASSTRTWFTRSAPAVHKDGHLSATGLRGGATSLETCPVATRPAGAWPRRLSSTDLTSSGVTRSAVRPSPCGSPKTRPGWRRSGRTTTRSSRGCYVGWSTLLFKKPTGSLVRYRNPDLRKVGGELGIGHNRLDSYLPRRGYNRTQLIQGVRLTSVLAQMTAHDHRDRACGSIFPPTARLWAYLG